jgi:putative FmdB family regulatory protein
MPIYDFRCRACSGEFELLVLGSAAAECPKCQSRDLEQLLSGFAVSSGSIRESNARSARRSASNSKDLKDKVIAHNEYRKSHND